MGQESYSWYNNNIMIGFADSKAKWEGNGYATWSNGTVRPWWQNDEFSMLYPGSIPISDIESKLFKFEIGSAPMFFGIPCDPSDPLAREINGDYYVMYAGPEHQVVYRQDSKEVFGVFSEGDYQVDQYKRTLIEGAAQIFDVSQHELSIGSAGLLRNGAVAWISMELPEPIETPVGMTYRPTVTLLDSYNGQFKYGVYYYRIIVVCDNGLLATQQRADLSYARKHTSRISLDEARRALKVMYKANDAFEAELEELAGIKVNDNQFTQVLDTIVPIPDPEVKVTDGGTTVKNQRSITNAENKQGELRALYYTDPRCEPWKGTALGVFQTFNTWNNHFSRMRGTRNEEGEVVQPVRVEKNMIRVVRGQQLKDDSMVLDVTRELCGAGASSGSSSSTGLGW